MHSSEWVRGTAVYAIWVFLLSFLWTPRVLADKNYQITEVDISAQLRADGNMEVTESRTYRFKGRFHYAYRVLPTTGPVQFRDFEVSENGQPYLLTDSEEPGTYRITEKPGEIEVRWFFRARNESRTFDFHCRVQNAIVRYEDAALLYYQFISVDWDRWQKNVHLQLEPPEPLSKSQINEWLHGPLWAESRIRENGSITAWCEHLPKHTYFEMRVLYPLEIFPQAPKKSGLVRAEIMEEEARWVEEANRQREMAIQKEEAKQKRWALGKWTVISLSLAGFMGWWRLFSKYGRRPTIPTQSKISSDIPAKTPPALVGYLLYNRQIYGGSLVGTLFDLARKGFISLREEQKEKKSLLGGSKKKSEYFLDLNRDYWREDSSKLKRYEDKLVRFIFGELAEGQNAINLKAIRKKQRKFTKFFQEWKKDVKGAGKEQEWFDKKSFVGMYYALGISSALLLLTVASAFLFGPWAAILGFSGVAVLTLAFFIPHRTREGQIEAQQWKALKGYLQKYHYRSADQNTLLGQIDDYFIYGVVLGLSKKIFKELAAMIPTEQVHRYVPWYIYHGTGAFSPETFGSAFSSAIATTVSAMSTASGAGGGATAGGGGGAGSGGGGAG